MVEMAEVKPESLLNLDDLLQCPVCYEIPTGQIFQCNEGHHVCGRCKMRLDVCPVCRALFFGTRNYAMEELIANFRKLRSFKLGAKPSNGSGSSESSTTAKETTSGEHENDVNNEDEENNLNVLNLPTQAPPPACKGLFRCLCCKSGQGERLPAARLLNHLRYFHAPNLLEGRTENGVYLQAWQFSTVPGKLITAVRVAEMGIFFLNIEISSNSVCAWLSMAAAPWVAQMFNYTVTICGNDREAIFTDSVWSVRSCEGSLKKRGHCLIVRDSDARALVAQSSMNGKLRIRYTPFDQFAIRSHPRAVLRIANRVNTNTSEDELGPFMQNLQNNVARITRSIRTREREEGELFTLQEAVELADSVPHVEQNSDERSESSEVGSPAAPRYESNANPERTMSRNARRRMRQRLRVALNGPIEPQPRASRQVNHDLPVQQPVVTYNGLFLTPSDSPPSSSSGPSQPPTRNKRRRRHRR